MSRATAVSVTARRQTGRPRTVAALMRVWGRGSVVAVLLTLSLVLWAEGRPGDLDPTFGVRGTVITDFGGFDTAHALVLQPDGKLVTAGPSGPGGTPSDIALARYLPNGRLDPTFGVGGQVTTAFELLDDPIALIVQRDGKLVAAGQAFDGSSIDVALARYLPDGRLDPTFGTGGQVTTDLGGSDEVARGLVWQPDGKLVAGGASCPPGGARCDFGLVRYVEQQPVFNDLVTFEPLPATFHFTPDPTGCPEGFVGTFRFEAQLTNISDQALSALVIEVTALTNDNLLQNADGGSGGVGARLTVPRQEGFTDGRLTPDEFVAVPLIICVTAQESFRLVVDVLGNAE
jgi:uncharacterized delta-60 repeat protein